MNSLALVFGVVYCFTAFTKADDGPRCFHFTWMGPRYTVEDTEWVNGSCTPWEYRGDGVPCIEPQVIVNGTGRPNMAYIMDHEHLRTPLTQRRVGRNQVCAKYSFYFNNYITNVTYMITRARFESLHNYGPITSGCYHQTVRGHQVEVCFCQDTDPNGMPCNTSTRFNLSSILCLLLLIIFGSYFKNDLV